MIDKYYFQILLDANFKSNSHLASELIIKVHNRFVFFTSLLFVINFIQIDNKINMGFLKGSIENPMLITYFLSLINVYYAIYFFVIIKPLLVKGNGNGLLQDFLTTYAGMIANDKIRNQLIQNNSAFDWRLLLPDYKSWTISNLDLNQGLIVVQKEFRIPGNIPADQILMVTEKVKLCDHGRDIVRGTWNFVYLQNFNKESLKFYKVYRHLSVFKNWNNFFIALFPYLYFFITLIITIYNFF